MRTKGRALRGTTSLRQNSAHSVRTIIRLHANGRNPCRSTFQRISSAVLRATSGVGTCGGFQPKASLLYQVSSRLLLREESLRVLYSFQKIKSSQTWFPVSVL